MVTILQVVDGVVRSIWRGAGALPQPPVGATFVTSEVVSTDVPNQWVVVSPTVLAEVREFDLFDGVGFTRPSPPKQFSELYEFFQLFTASQRKAIRNMATRGHSTYDANVEDFIEMTQFALQVPLKHPMTIAGLTLLETKGVLTAADRIRIANGIRP